MSLALILLFAAPPPLQVGAPAPRFTLAVRNPDSAGMKRVSSRALTREKRRLVIDFTASWCAPCKAAVPRLRALAKADPRLVVTLVVVDETPEGRDAMLALLADFPGPVVLDPHRLLARRYGVDTLPHAVFVDATGALRWIGIGADAAGLEAALQSKGAP